MYDWANSAYSTILITIVVAYVSHILPGGTGTVAYAWGIGLSMLLAAALSPIVGAMADINASKRRWLALTALGGAACGVAMAAIPPEWPWVVVAAFFFTSLGFELSLGFYNGFLPEITTKETIDRVSAWGFALGYVGGALPLIAAMLMAMSDDQLSPWLPDYLRGDLNATAAGRFAVEVSPGDYQVTLVVGDARQAHEEMVYLVQGTEVARVSTSRGEYKTLAHAARVDEDGELTIELRAGQDGGLAVINGLSIEEPPHAPAIAPFDFGKTDSLLKAGHVRVAPDDGYQVWNLEEKGLPAAEDADDQPEPSPAELRFGWQTGQIEARDRILSTRLRAGVLLMGLWWGLFSIPTLLVLRDRAPRPAVKLSPLGTARQGVQNVLRTLRHVRVYATLSLFLLGFLFYNEGVQTVISQASNFATYALGMTAVELGGVILMIQFLAIPGAMLVGRLSSTIGQKPTLMGCLAIWMVILVGAFFVTEKWQFWVMGGAVAMVMGGTQSVSRAIMGYMTPPERTAEFFGFFNLSGKATSFMGPMLFGAVIWLTGEAHVAILSVLIFFIIGTTIVVRLNFARGRREALEDGTKAA